MVLEFFYDNLSQPCRAVYMLLKTAGVDFTATEVDLLKGEHYKPEFIKKNPYRKVPVIDDDGFVLAESVAIMRYITVKFNLADHWYPRADVKKQARVDEFLHWQHLCIRKPAIAIIPSLFRSRLGFGQRFPKKPYDPEVLKQSREELTKAINHLDEYFLQDRPFIAGDEISAADIIGVNELIQLQMVEQEDLYTGSKRVVAWIQRVHDRMKPSYDEAVTKVVGARANFIAAKDQEAK